MEHIGNQVTPYLYRLVKASETDERDEARLKLIYGLTALSIIIPIARVVDIKTLPR